MMDRLYGCDFATLPAICITICDPPPFIRLRFCDPLRNLYCHFETLPPTTDVTSAKIIIIHIL